MRFIVTTDGSNKHNLQAMAETFANELWIPAHLSTTEAEVFSLDQFKRAVAAELEMLEVRTTVNPDTAI